MSVIFQIWTTLTVVLVLFSWVIYISLNFNALTYLEKYFVLDKLWDHIIEPLEMVSDAGKENNPHDVIERLTLNVVV